jgi:hypothetical protein
MPFGSTRADLLERSLQGQKCTDQEVLELVATVGLIAPLTSRAGAPQPEFVSALGIRLRAEALALPARESRTTQESIRFPSPIESRRSAVPPRVFAVGRGLPRVLAGATASLLLVGGIVGGASRSALPGGLLYPVKQLLDSTAVQLASSDFDRGMTLLSQAQEHISDARALVDRDGAELDPASVDVALVNARDAVSSGQRTLLAEFDRTGNPQARSSVAGKVALCGQPCASIIGSALPGPPSSATPTNLPSPIAPAGGIGITVPTVSVPLVTVAPIPGVSASVPATSVPLVTLVPIPGVSTAAPSLPVPMVTLPPIPGWGVSVPLP